MSSGKSDFETILKWVVVVILAIAALKVLAVVLGMAFVLGGILLFRVLPLVLLVWAAYSIIQWLFGKNGESSRATTDF